MPSILSRGGLAYDHKNLQGAETTETWWKCKCELGKGLRKGLRDFVTVPMMTLGVTKDFPHQCLYTYIQTDMHTYIQSLANNKQDT